MSAADVPAEARATKDFAPKAWKLVSKRWRRLTAEKQVLIVKDWWYRWHALLQPHEDASYVLQLFTSSVKQRVDCFGSMGKEPYCVP